MEGLLPCPFCRRDVTLRHDDAKGFWIQCSTPGCYMTNLALVQPHRQKETLISAWNRRHFE